MPTIQAIADRLVGLFVPNVTAAAACERRPQTACRSYQCSSTSNTRFVQHQTRECDTWECGTNGACTPWRNTGCCAI
jgi:hypothetical protein